MGSTLHENYKSSNNNFTNISSQQKIQPYKSQLLNDAVISNKELEEKLNKKIEIQRRMNQEKEELENLIAERTRDYVKEVSNAYKNKNKKYYGSINDNKEKDDETKSRNIDLYDNLDSIKKEKILRFWEKRRIYKMVDDIIQDLIDYTVHSHYYNKNFDKLNFNNNILLYDNWNINDELDNMKKKLINLHNNFRSDIWVKKVNESTNSDLSSSYNSQELNSESKLRSKNSSNLSILKMIYSKQIDNLPFISNASTIDTDKIEKEYEEKINNISLETNDKLKEIKDAEKFISSSWDSIKQSNINNTLKIINYYGPIYYNLSWPTEYIIPEFDEELQKKQNLIYWNNDEIKNMISSNISNINDNLMSNNILDDYKDIYELEKNANNKIEKKLNSKSNNKIKKHLISKKISTLSQYYPKNNHIRNNKIYTNKNTLSSTLQTSLLVRNKKGIVALPTSIYFNKFTSYKTYSSILIIKNITYETQRVQVTIEPEENSNYFRIYKIYSPGENGLISPGLSAHYKIVFNPESLKTCFATVNVTSSFGDKLMINVLAKIKEPKIDIPPVLNCNPCIVNSSSVTDIVIKNTGGKGKFIIIDFDDKRTCEELHDIKLDHDYSNYIYKKDSFKIVPGYCEINENDKINLKIYFKPKLNINFKKENKELNYIEELKVCFAWDNCEKQELVIKGNAQEPCISIENNDQLTEKQSYININTNEEIVYSNIIKFDTCNINSEITKKIKLKNITDVSLPVKWNIIDTPIDSMNMTNNNNNISKENTECSNNDENGNEKINSINKINDLQEEEEELFNINSNENINSIVSINSSSHIKIPNYNIGKKMLKIYPSETIFKPREIIEFTFSFKPKNYKHYDIIAQLLYNKNLKYIEDEINDNELISIRCIGKSEPVTVKIVPAIINTPVKLNVDEKYVKEITIYNYGKSVISYSSFLKNETPEYVDMKLDKSNGVIEPNSNVKVYLSLIGSFPGAFKGNIVFRFDSYKLNDINVNINGEVYYKAGSFIFDKKIIDFGIIQLGSHAKENLLLTNNSSKRIKWKINLYTKNKEKCDYMTIFEPKNGYLEPKDSIKIDIIFIPLWYQLFRGEIICELTNEKCEYTEDIIQENEFVLSSQKFFSHSIRLIANVLTPKVILLNNNTSENCMCYLNITKELFITLKNVTLLPTHYKILPVYNKNIDIYFEKEEGIIKGNEEINIKLYAKGKTIGKFDGIEINAIIDGMVENFGKLAVKLDLDVKGLDVNIEIYNSVDDFKNNLSDKSGCLNYGNDCKLFKSYTKIIKIINTFNVESKFEISLGKYNINYDALVDSKHRVNSKSLILREKNNQKVYFYSKNGQQFIKEKIFKKENIENLKNIIYDKYGAGFKISPRKGILRPYDVVNVEVTAYNNISGIYDDILTVKVSNGIEKSIPVNMEVKGVPLTYINILPKENEQNIKELFFSTRLVASNVDFNERSCISIPNGNNSATKTICILNESPKDVTLSWELLISKTKIYKFNKFKSIISKNSDLINMSLKLLNKVTTISPEILEVKQILEGGSNKNISSNSKTISPCSTCENLPVLSLNSLYDDNQKSLTNINYDKIENENTESIIENNNEDNNELNENDENKLLSKDVSILALEDYNGIFNKNIEIIKESEVDLSKKKIADEMNVFAHSYKRNKYDIFTIEPKTVTIKSNEQVSFKINMKSSFEGIYDALLYSRLSYNGKPNISNKKEEDEENIVSNDIRNIINNESITKLHLFGIITVPRIKFENNLDYYHINLKYSYTDTLKTFNIINPSENIYIFKMIPSNENIILGYTNNFYIDGIINDSLTKTNSKKSVTIDDDTIIQLKAYETKIITITLNKNMTLEEYNSLKNTDLKIKIEFINGVYQVIPISFQ